MSILAAIALAILYALLGILLAIVLIPFRARAAGAVHDGMPSGAVSVDWGLGLLGVGFDTDRRVSLRLLWIPIGRFSMSRSGRTEKKKHPRSPRKEKRKEGKKGGGLGRLRAALAERESFRRMAGRIVRALHLRLRASGRLGIGDPADTATLYALMAVLRTLPGVELEVELDWVEEELELELEAGLRVWIVELLAVAVALLLTRSNRRALRAAFGWGTA